MIRGVKHLLCLERLRELKFSLKKSYPRWDLISVYRHRVEGVKEISPDSSLWYTVTGQEVIGTSWKRKFFLSVKNQNYRHGGWLNTGTGYLERLWNLCLWRYFKLNWDKVWTACSGWLDQWRCHPTTSILWSVVSVCLRSWYLAVVLS